MKKLILTVFLCVCAFYSVSAQYKLDENFAGTFPPTGWSTGPAICTDTPDPVWTRSASNGYGIAGTGSAFCYFYAWDGSTSPNPIDSLITPIFTAATASDTLSFDHAHRTYISENDDLKIYTSTDGGATWTLLVDLPGNGAVGTGTVTVTPSTGNFLAPTAGQWLSKKFVPGAGVNRIKFEVITAYGNNLFLDNIKVGVPPSIDVAATSVGTTGTNFALGNGSVTPTGTVKNNGGSSATFTVTRRITPGGYVDTQTITSLAANTTSPVTFASWNYNVNTAYTIKDSVFLSGDVNHANDTLTGFLTYATPKNTLILNVDNRSRDSLVAHLNALGLNGTYDQTTTFPAIPLSSWRTMIVLFGSAGGWSAGLRDSMKAYLDGSSPAAKKSLIIFGNDLGYNFDPRRNAGALEADTLFYRQYLHAQYWADDWIDVFPTSDSTIKGMTGFTSITAQRVNDPFPDLITPAFWSPLPGTTTAAFIPVTESGDGDSCTAVAFAGTNFNVFYGSNVYYGYVPTVTGAMSPQGNMFAAIKGYIEINGGVLPVELASFSSTVNNRNVTLNWSTTAEHNNAGFDIERNPASANNWSKIGNVNGAGNSTTSRSYTFADNNIATGRYSYRLKQMDFNGNFEYFNLSNEVIVGVPTKFDLSQNYPNPFNPTTKINYDLAFDSKVAIKLFDIAGREVASLVNTVQPAGYYTVSFNASSLSSGVYFYQISADGGNQNFVKTLKMLLVK